MSTRNSWGPRGKSKLSPHSGTVALRQLNPSIKRGHKVFFKSKTMPKFYSHINLNLTCKKIIPKNKLNFRPFSNLSF